MIAPDVLAFADRRINGRFAVTEPAGATVAQITASWWSGASFRAVDGAGEPLCSGSRRGWLSTWWDAIDATGAPLATLRASFWGRRKNVTLPDGRALSLEGRWFGRDWSLCDASGRAMLSSVPSTGAWSFRPDAWVVRCQDASLSLAQVVAIVELNRLMVKAARSSASAATA